MGSSIQDCGCGYGSRPLNYAHNRMNMIFQLLIIKGFNSNDFYNWKFPIGYASLVA